MNINKVLIETNQTRSHMTMFFLINWEHLRRFSLNMNSVKIPSEKDKKKQREYYIRFKLIVTLWHFTLFTNYTLTLVCDSYVNKNIVMKDLVRFVLVCILLICTFYNFYKYKTKDICPQSFALTCVKSVSVTINSTQR